MALSWIARGAASAERGRRLMQLRGVTPNGHPLWAPWEVDPVLSRYPDYRSIFPLLQRRTRPATYGKTGRLGVTKPRGKATRYCSDVQLAEILGRTPGAIKLRRNELRCLRVPRKESTVPVVRDVVREAKRRGVKLTKLTKALKCGRVDPADDRSPLNFSAVAKVTEAFGGHLYAEWDD